MNRPRRLTWAVLCIALPLTSAFIAGCGDGEVPAQSAALNKAPLPVKEGESRRSNEQPGARSSGHDRFMAFESATPNVVEGDTNRVADVFLYDRQTKRSMRVSAGAGDFQANGGSFAPEPTPDGGFVVFESLASNLVPDDTNRHRDVFVYARSTGQTERLSVNSAGEQGDNLSQAAHLSEDGRYVVFESLASNLVPHDANGVSTFSCTTGRRGRRSDCRQKIC